MAKTKGGKTTSEPAKRSRPALTPEARENQLISLAIDRAEQQLLDGTASSQVITHYLKLGSSKERLEKERLQHENELLKAKTQSLLAGQRSDEMYEQALKAFTRYSGESDEMEEWDDD